MSNVEVVDPQTVPFLPPKANFLRMRHFDPQVFNTSETSHLYKFVDALTGEAGAGSVKKEFMLSRLSANLDTMYFGDLDRSFGNIQGLSRFVSESYSYNPYSDLLTSDQWNEVQVKDSWYRQRIKDFFQACSLGGTPLGIRVMLRAALGVDCEVFEIWRYLDDYNSYVQTEFNTVVQSYGRLATSVRNEFVVKPHKDSITPGEWLKATRMIERIKPADSVVTVNADGLAVHSLVDFRTVAADSSYFIVERLITGVPDLESIPKDSIDVENIKWIQANIPNIAPTSAFGQTQEHSYYYLFSEKDSNSAIDTVVYEKEDSSTGQRTVQFALNQEFGVPTFTNWIDFEKVDSPDNFPGGKFGQHPSEAPAVYENGGTYVFPYISQENYVITVSSFIINRGGEIQGNRYRLPVLSNTISSKVNLPQLSLSVVEPTRDSTISLMPLVRVKGQALPSNLDYPYPQPT